MHNLHIPPFPARLNRNLCTFAPVRRSYWLGWAGAQVNYGLTNTPCGRARTQAGIHDALPVGVTVLLSNLTPLIKVYGDAERYAGYGQPIAPEGCTQWIAFIFAKYENRSYGMYVLIGNGTGIVVGFAGTSRSLTIDWASNVFGRYLTAKLEQHYLLVGGAVLTLAMIQAFCCK